jgi:methyltransferase (TIGR00027 family)
MASIRNVAGTAFVVAEFRNDENKEAFPLYRDPYVHLFLDEETKKAADRISASFPPVRNNVRLRTRYLDEQLDGRLEHGCKQVVILGAGLDTRAQRKAVPSVTYFEIDDADTLSFKQAKLAESGVYPAAEYIAGNYVTENFISLLRRREFDFDLPTHFIWEGNTMYLPEEAISRVLRDMTSHVRQCSVSFDYVAPEMIAKTTGEQEVTDVAERFAAMGAPWISSVNSLENLAESCGMKVLDNAKFTNLYRAYWPDKKLDSAMYDYYSICTLRSLGADLRLRMGLSYSLNATGTEDHCVP